MLKKWKITNFKSFGDCPEIELSRLNIFTGANSSGKSTILQSILLLKQTLQYGPTNRTLVLNGPILKIGTFSDVLNEKTSRNKDFQIEWTISDEITDEEKQSGIAPAEWTRENTYNAFRQSDALKSVSSSLVWTSSGMGAQSSESSEELTAFSELYPALKRGELACSFGEEDQRIWKYAAIEAQPGDAVLADSEMQPYSTNMDSVSAKEIREKKPSTKIGFSFLLHSFPSFMIVQYDRRAQRAKDMAETIVNGSSPFTISSGAFGDEEIPNSVIEQILDWAQGREITFERPKEALTVESLSKIIRPIFRPDALRNWLENRSSRSVYSAELIKLIEDALLEALQEDIAPDIEMPDHFRRATDSCKTFFTKGIRYLGPLRDEPKPVYPIEALEAPTEVGYRGEHTAAVLDLNKSRQVQFIRPTSVTSGNMHPEKISLIDAVNEWSDYMGVAANVVTKEHSVFGHQLQVTTDQGSNTTRDLTNVGVGVSQVLPILVMTLLAPSGGTLIFEQPELHLHPKVQARLADFFFAAAFSGKQCFLETHSEYLVDRVRRRIAEGPDERVDKLAKIFFVEREGSQSRCRDIRVNEFGAVEDWPKDFFDQSPIEAEAILRAAMKKTHSSEQ